MPGKAVEDRAMPQRRALSGDTIKALAAWAKQVS